MAEERFVRQYFDIPQWYVFAEHEVSRLNAIIRENVPIARLFRASYWTARLCATRVFFVIQRSMSL